MCDHLKDQAKAKAESDLAEFRGEIRKQMDFVLQEHAKTEISSQLMMEAVREMARGIALLTVNAENDRSAAERERNIFLDTLIRFEDQANKDRQEMRDSITRFEDQANKDRQEMRDSIIRLENQANKDRQEMRDSIENLSNIASDIHIRVTRLEDKAN